MNQQELLARTVGALNCLQWDGVITVDEYIALYRRARERSNPPQPIVKVVQRRYTPDEIETLKRLYVRGFKTAVIAKRIGRSHGSVLQKVYSLQQKKVLPKRYATAGNNNNNNTGKEG